MVGEAAQEGPGLWQRLVEPSAAIRSPIERARARLLVRLCLLLGGMGVVFDLILLQIFPGFETRFPFVMATSILVLACGIGARGVHWRSWGALGISSTLVCALLIGWVEPKDQVWPILIVTCTIFSTAFLSPRVSIGIALAGFVGSLAVVLLAPGYEDHINPQVPLVIQILCNPLIIVVAVQADRMEKTRLADEERHRRELDEAQELSGVGNWSVDLMGERHFLSSQGEHFLEPSHLTAKGYEAIIDLVESSYRDELRQSIDELIRGKRDEVELRKIPYGDRGERGFLSLVIVPRGRPAQGLEGTFEDVTDEMRQAHEQELLRDQVLEARRLETLGRMAGGIAHDFNNVLTVIVTATNILGGSERSEPLLEEMRVASDRAQNLVQQLVAFAGKQGLAPALLTPGERIEELQPIIQRLVGEEIELELVGLESKARVLFDSTQLEQIIVNLCVNAKDAMPSGGRLTLGLKEHVAGCENPELELWVQDTGVGMDPATLDKAFEPFFTTKEEGKGTGLGLATVDGIVRQSGGRLEVDTTPGEGCTFRIFIPIATSGPLETVDKPTSLRGKQSATILLVDDEGPIRKLLTPFLRSNGYRVHSASGGAQGLKHFEIHDDDIDIVVSDVQMPDMLGPNMVERMRRERPTLPVLFISGYADNIPKTDTRTRFLAKPFPPPRLLQELERLTELLADDEEGRAKA